MTRFDAPLFVIGCARSGTTILHDLLMKASPHSVDLTSDDDFECRSFWQAFGLKIGSRRTGSLCLYASGGDIANDHRSEIQTYVANRGKDAGIITKNPHLMNKIGFVADVLPNARFVLIVREIMGVVASTKIGFNNANKGDDDYPPFIHYWPNAKFPCWSYLEDDITKRNFNKNKFYRGAKNLFGIFRNAKNQSVNEPGRVFPHIKLSDFEKEHPDRNRYYPGDGFACIPESWLSLNSNALKQLTEIDLSRWMVISYLDLVENPKITIKRILDFGEFNKTIYEFLPKNLDRNTSKKWRENLTKEEQFIVRQKVYERKDDYKKICDAVGAELLEE